jgi:hypothetical protein
LEAGGPIDEARVSLTLYGESLDPDDVSRRLGCAPTRSFRKGETRRPSGRDGRPMLHGAWFLTVEGKPPVSVDDLVTNLLERFPKEEQFWNDLRRDYSVQVRVGIHTSGWNRGFDLSSNAVRLVALTGAPIGFDLYFYGDDA